MFSPSKSYSYLAQKQPENITAFKQETISLLRQQSEKFRELKALLSSKEEELLIKEEQVKFLKGTIRQLQNQSQVLIQEKNDSKLKLQKIVQEVQNYNQNVVRPICQEKQQLKKINVSLKMVIEQLQTSLKSANSQKSKFQSTIKSLTAQLQQTNSQLKLHQVKCFELQQRAQKQKQKSSRQAEQVLRMTNLLHLQCSKREKLEGEVNLLNKQLSTVINKHNSSMKEYELKLKDLQSNKIDVAEVTVYQELVRSKQQQIAGLKNQLNSQTKISEEIKSKYLGQKEKWLKQLTQSKIKIVQVETDLTNLNKSIQMDKKIVQFQSQYSALFYSVYDKFESLSQQNCQLKETHQQLVSINQKLSRDVQKLSERLKDCEIEQTLMKTQLHQEIERLESTYEGKLLSLNLKIRNQEEALERLKKGQIQAMEQKQALYHQIELVQKDFTAYKQTAEKSLQKVNQENYRMANEMQQLHQICEQNVDSKRVVDRLKHLLHYLLTGIHYFQLMIIRQKQKERKIYLPILNSYFLLYGQLVSMRRDQNSKKSTKNQVPAEYILFEVTGFPEYSKNILKSRPNLKHTKKLRVAVWTVIAAIRIGRGLQRMSKNWKGIISPGIQLGVQLKLLKGLNRRNKTPSTAQLMERQAEAYLKNQEPESVLMQLLKNTQKAFSWSQPNYRSLYLNSSKLVQTLNVLKNK